MKAVKMIVSILSKIASINAFGLVRQKGLIACLASLTFIYRRSHLRRRYWLVSLSYLTYVPFSRLFVDGLVTSM